MFFESIFWCIILVYIYTKTVGGLYIDFGLPGLKLKCRSTNDKINHSSLVYESFTWIEYTSVLK